VAGCCECGDEPAGSDATEFGTKIGTEITVGTLAKARRSLLEYSAAKTGTILNWNIVATDGIEVN
jgi:hypothetical protein